GHSLSRAGSPARIAAVPAVPVRIARARRGASHHRDAGRTRGRAARVPDSATVAEPRITLLGRPRCHLCEYAREALEWVRQGTGVWWVWVGVDSEQELAQGFGGRVTRSLLDGRGRGGFRVEEERLIRGRGGEEGWSGTVVA